MNKYYTNLLRGYEFITFPITLLGMAFHYTVETPFFVGRAKANESLHVAAFKAQQEDNKGEDD